MPVSYFSRAPTGTSSRKPASTGFPPSSDAATIMPFDSRPRIFRGARLATITTLRPTKSLGRVGLGDPGQDLPHFGADVDFEPQKFVRLGHALGDFHHAHAQFDLGEVVDCDFPAVGRGSGAAAARLRLRLCGR